MEHLEGNLIESKGKDAYLVTLVDRFSAYTWAIKVPSNNAETVLRAIIEALDKMPPLSINAIIFDNGKEFNHYRKIEEALGCDVYFANPYAAYQRGLNEHINRQYRRHMPKNKRFAHLTDDDVRAIQDAINVKPRKSRNFTNYS
ncbi:MAG: IS30 family transposase [Spirochaetes bacterium]|nr:IS30 family transposase [Spirochaetota bacterium]